jgi:hypothetical protein
MNTNSTRSRSVNDPDILHAIGNDNDICPVCKDDDCDGECQGVFEPPSKRQQFALDFLVGFWFAMMTIVFVSAFTECGDKLKEREIRRELESTGIYHISLDRCQP